MAKGMYELKNVHIDIDVLFQTIVSTCAYPDIGPIFKVSTRWCKDSDNPPKLRTQETRIFGSCNLDGNGGASVWSRDLDGWQGIPAIHMGICKQLARGELALEIP